MKEKITMWNHRALAAAIVATGAGAVIFLSTGQEPASPVVPAGLGPVPVVVPPIATEVPSVHPAVPAAERVAPVPSSTLAPVTRPAPKRAAVTPPTTRKVAPAPRVTTAPRASAPTTQQQPQPADTEPNGTGGWQLPACYDESCVAPKSAHAAQAAPKPGLLDQLTAPILDLLGGL